MLTLIIYECHSHYANHYGGVTVPFKDIEKGYEVARALIEAGAIVVIEEE